MAAFAPGMTLHGRFTLRERIGAGGMSEVWRAEDEVLGRPVAGKALAVPLAADPVLRAATWAAALARGGAYRCSGGGGAERGARPRNRAPRHQTGQCDAHHGRGEGARLRYRGARRRLRR